MCGSQEARRQKCPERIKRASRAKIAGVYREEQLWGGKPSPWAGWSIQGRVGVWQLVGTGACWENMAARLAVTY